MIAIIAFQTNSRRGRKQRNGGTEEEGKKWIGSENTQAQLHFSPSDYGYFVYFSCSFFPRFVPSSQANSFHSI